jgi:hypothetical protein
VANGLISDNGHSALTATLELPEMPAPQALAEDDPCAPFEEAIESLVRPLIESTNLAPPPQPAPEPLAPEVLSYAMALQAELALDSMAQQSIAAEQSAIRGIVASFQQKPKISLLSPASEDVVAPAPVCIQWMRIPKPRILPVPPKDLNHRDLLSGLQSPPLAGPCVPQELRSLTERRDPANHHARKKAGLPAWTVSFLVALLLFLGVGSLLQYFSAKGDAKAAAATTQPSDQAVSVPSADHPASKLVEVTGLRIAAGSNRRPQLEFIVVNHSATALSDIGLQIAVRSASSTAGVAPLFRVSTTVPSLGPYQSREFRAELDPEVHATDVPDWQSLRADVHITQ